MIFSAMVLGSFLLGNFSEASNELVIHATPQSDGVIRGCDDDEEIRGHQNKPKWVSIHCSEEVNTWRLAPAQGAQTLPMTQQMNIVASSDKSDGERNDKHVINREDRFNFICPKLEAIVEKVKKTWAGDCDALVNALREYDGSVGQLCFAQIQSKREAQDFETIPTGRAEEYCAKTSLPVEKKIPRPGRGQ